MHAFLPPYLVLDLNFPSTLDCFGKIYQALCRVLAAVENHVLDEFQEVFGNLRVNLQHPRVDDAHVHPGVYSVVQKRRVHRLAHGVVAAKREGEVRDAARDERVGEVFFDPAGCCNEVDGVAAVLLDTRSDCQNIWVEDDVLGRKTDFVYEDFIGAFANLDAALERVRLSLLVKRHNDYSSAITPNEPRLLLKDFFALFERNRVDDALAL